MPYQGFVRVIKLKLPAISVQPVNGIVHPYADSMTQLLSGGVIFEADIRVIEVVHLTELVDADMQFAIA